MGHRRGAAVGFQLSLLEGGDAVALAALLPRIDIKYRPVWEKLPPREALALARYFLPSRSTRKWLAPTRPHVLKWYCPFADQKHFASGHRYCINVYAGLCAHRCAYCYAAAYQRGEAHAKTDFRKSLERDLDALEAFDVPRAPVHLSNSTDPLQPLERTCGDTLYALRVLGRHRARFATIALLTKNPILAAEPEYLAALDALGPGAHVEVSLAFLDEDACRVFDPGAPPAAERIRGLRALRAAGVPVVLRVDPLLPRSPLPGARRSLADFGLPEAQPPEDLERIVGLGAEVGVTRIVWSVAKLGPSRTGPASQALQVLRRLYESMAAPGRLEWRSGSYRLPERIARPLIVEPFLEICARHGVDASFCAHHLLRTL